MKNVLKLPDGYVAIQKVDLQNDKKLAILINAVALVIAIVFLFLGVRMVPLQIDVSQLSSFLLRLVFIIVGILVYMILHELVHGIFIRIFSKSKVHYGFTGLYAYAGSHAFFNKKSYIVIALAPVVLLGLLLLLITYLVPQTWFWPVYFIQIMNLSGAAGDLYVTFAFSKFPSSILIQDTGVSMTIYSKSQ